MYPSFTIKSNLVTLKLQRHPSNIPLRVVWFSKTCTFFVHTFFKCVLSVPCPSESLVSTGCTSLPNHRRLPLRGRCVCLGTKDSVGTKGFRRMDPGTLRSYTSQTRLELRGTPGRDYTSTWFGTVRLIFKSL